MKLLSLSKNNPATTTITTIPTTLAWPSSWPWQAYCHRPKTLSFRGGDDLFRTVNSAFIEDLDSPLEPSEEEEEEEGYEDRNNDDSIETVIRGARSEGRLFFEPAGETSSVLAVESEDGASGEHDQEEELGKGVAMCVQVESRDPYRDFRMSMDEMVEAHELTGKWDSLEDLLRCYLQVNDRTNHAYIFRAFVDLLLSSGCQRTGAPADGSSCSSSCNCNNNGGSGNTTSIFPPTASSPCSPLSFCTYSSSCFSSSDSLSTTPCCISIIGEAEENSSSSGSGNGSGSVSTGQQRGPRLPLKVAEQNRPPERDESSSSTSSSSDV